MEALRKPIKHKIQEYAERIDLEAVLRQKLQEYSEQGTVSFSLGEIDN
jgi:epoxyqueuosine reductase QueG